MSGLSTKFHPSRGGARHGWQCDKHTSFSHPSRGGARHVFLAAAALAGSILLAAVPVAAQGGVSVHVKTAPSEPPTLPPGGAPSAAELPQEKAAPAAPAEAAMIPSSEPIQAGEAAPQAADSGEKRTAKTSSPLDAGWDTDTQTQISETPAHLTDEEALRLVQQVNDYFNNLTKLKADFVQTNANDETQRGTFYFQRPGKVRFDYAPPSKLRIISDGRYLAIENHDLRTADRYPLESTPFKLLLSDKVDLLEDARILSIDRGENVVIIALEDKTGESPGRIRLFFKTEPEFHLASWIITDPQGLDTRIDISDLKTDVELAADLFRFSDIALPTFNR